MDPEIKKINDIKEEYKETPLSGIPDFIDKYIADGRPGVKKVLGYATKKMENLRKEKERMYKMFSYERENRNNYNIICGIDEAGRGPLAGPVVAAAVIFPENSDILYINDSKKLTEKKREELYEVIFEKAISVGIGTASPEKIDEINILQATYEAMRDAIDSLSLVPDLSLNDAVTIPGLPFDQIPIIKGDAKSASIAAASIIAKVTRDRIMAEYDKVMPEYDFKKHKGYGTKEHIELLKKYGPSPIHRRSFISHFV